MTTKAEERARLSEERKIAHFRKWITEDYKAHLEEKDKLLARLQEISEWMHDSEGIIRHQFPDLAKELNLL